jgi:hypothetical protein
LFLLNFKFESWFLNEGDISYIYYGCILPRFDVPNVFLREILRFGFLALTVLIPKSSFRDNFKLSLFKANLDCDNLIDFARLIFKLLNYKLFF